MIHDLRIVQILNKRAPSSLTNFINYLTGTYLIQIVETKNAKILNIFH